MQFDVVKKARKNIVYGIAGKTVFLLCPFITRAAIQYILNSQYLGLTSLFNSVFMVLNLAELGFSSAVVYNMFKPVADGDTDKVNALLNYYRRVYRKIGSLIAAVGILIIPILPKLISGTYPDDVNLTCIYLIYLFNTVLGYFMFGYMTSLIVVNQREDVNSLCNMISQVALTVVQIAALLLTHNFYIFAALSPIFTVVNNIWIAHRVRQLFPQYLCRGELDTGERKEIRKLVAGTFAHKLCTVSRFSFDSICISAFFGLTMTAIYSNYYSIFSGISQMLFVISDSFIGGVGNHVATKSIDENYDELNRINFVYLWIGGFCAICMLCLYQPFMELWMGRDMLLENGSMILMCVLFYACRLGEMRFMYYTANGLWWHNRWRSITETLMNIVLNIILGRLMGVNGIMLATLISLVCCNFIWSTVIVFKQYFGLDKIKNYYYRQVLQTGVIVVAAAVSLFISILIPVSGCIAQILIRIVICIIVPNVIMYIAYRKSDEYRYLMNILKRRRFVK